MGKRRKKLKPKKIDSTKVEFDESLVDHEFDQNSGYPDVCAVRDTEENLELMGARDFPDSLWIEKSDWKDAARENDKYKTWAESRRNRFTNQGGGNGARGTHECTCHALTQVFEAAWNAQRESSAAGDRLAGRPRVPAEWPDRRCGGRSRR